MKICVLRAVGLTPGPYLIGLYTETYKVCRAPEFQRIQSSRAVKGDPQQIVEAVALKHTFGCIN